VSVSVCECECVCVCVCVKYTWANCHKVNRGSQTVFDHAILFSDQSLTHKTEQKIVTIIKYNNQFILK
jgi:hypothetical protein